MSAQTAVNSALRPAGVEIEGKEGLFALVSFTGTEALSRLFHFDLILSTEKNKQVDPADTLGKSITIRLDTGASKPRERYFNGMVSHCRIIRAAADFTLYHVEMVPRLWLATLNRQCRCFLKVTSSDIIKQVLGDYGISAKGLGSFGPKFDYRMQYMETDFNLICRLLEEVGVFYYFKHNNGSHELHFKNNGFAGGDADHDAVLEDFLTAVSPEEGLLKWDGGPRIQPYQFKVFDFQYTNSSGPLVSAANGSRNYSSRENLHEEYPGMVMITEGPGNAAGRVAEEYGAQQEVFTGDTGNRLVTPCCQVEVGRFAANSMNGKFAVLQAQYTFENTLYESGGIPASGGMVDVVDGQEITREFKCLFTAIRQNVVYRPPRVTSKTMIQGPQTAIVTDIGGASDDEKSIYGCVKVKFHWSDTVESDWMRVGQVWAGQAWGAVFIPRVSQEVIVEFLDGDPERPIVVGSVYNDKHTPPYDLPANISKSGIKTNSCSDQGADQGGGFNEIRFDDKQGEEQLFIQAQRNMDIRVQEMSYETVVKDKHLLVMENQILKTEKDYSSDILGLQTTKVGKDYSLKVVGGLNEEVGGDASTKVTGQSTIKAKEIVLDAQLKITLKVGGTHIVLDSSGITIKGPMVEVEGSGKADFKGGMVNVEGSGITVVKGSLVKIN